MFSSTIIIIMKRFLISSFLCTLCIVIFPQCFRPHGSSVTALPLQTKSRWIINENGKRVKLACVNWASHMDTAFAEGLSMQPVNSISKLIPSMGFDCVRFSWPLFLVTNGSLASMSVRKSFESLGLHDSLRGLQSKNPSFLDMTLLDAFKEAVSSIGRNGLMIILDNHISKPGWCCSSNDGNGFFGDEYFDPNQWINGLTQVATMFRGLPYVVAMSLRNELRGPRQNVDDWFRYMQKGAEAVHSANPDILIILSGLSYDTDLSFLKNQTINLTFTGKLVFEAHWYSWTFFGSGKWSSGNASQVCAMAEKSLMNRAGFVLMQQGGWPLFVSEFGGDLTGADEDSNRYLDCFLATAARLDFDWALWTLMGSYYIREGKIGVDEPFGLLTKDFSAVRNSTFLHRISAIQPPSQGRLTFGL